ncbi:MAG: transcription antitermination factor NusB [Firmicutes bacterium]|nr:transcription antitermination factor NusB [Bacillota bacterium]MBQ7059328.1 transcription antitermination factor NusB [Bacillota bacterium]
MTRSEAREHAFRILYEIQFRPDEDQTELAEIYMEVFPDEVAQPDERAFILKEVLGTMEHVEELDQKIEGSLHGWSLKRLSKVDLAILRLALYEIEYAEDIPEKVSINEAVELAKKYSQDAARGFINGVLANFASSGKE